MGYNRPSMMMLEADICDPLAGTVEAALETAHDGFFPGFYFSPEPIDDRPPFIQVSPKHHRSFAVQGPVVIEDEFGNQFSSMQYKGSFFPALPQAREGTGVYEHEAYGLADHEVLGSGQISYELRAAGLPTEYITYTARLQEGIALGHLMPIDRYRQILAQLNGNRVSRPGFAEWAESAEFFGIARATETAARLNDIDSRFLPTDNLRPLKEMLTHQNRNAAEFGERPVTIDQTTEVERLLFNALPARMGQATGILHELGLEHGNLHGGNWLVSGMFVDVDTVHRAIEEDTGYELRKQCRQVPQRIQQAALVLRETGAIHTLPEAEPIRQAFETGYARADEPLYPLL